MVPGVIWALVGLAVCSIQQRGQLVTTVVTAAAGALGLGMGELRNVHTGAAGWLPWAVGTPVVLAIVAGVWLLWHNTAPRRKHGSAAMASTRFVLYTAPEDKERAARQRQRDRIRNARR